MTTKRWHLRSETINEFVHAVSQFEAYDALRYRPASHFGLIVQAEPNEAGEDNSYPVRTSLLMFRWGRDADAQRFIALGIKEGLPDTTREDLAACGR